MLVWGFATGGLAANPSSEKYHGAFDFYQELTTSIPEDTYKLYAQAFYRQDGDPQTPPVLYANSDNTDLAVFNAHNEGTAADMNGASTSFSAGQYVNSLTTSVTNGLRFGINITEDNQWVIWDNFALQRVGSQLSTVATALPANGDMAANTWYSYSVSTGHRLCHRRQPRTI